MVTTSPDNLWSPNASDPYNLTTDLAAMQTSVQAALTNRPKTYRTGLTDAQRIALPSGERFEGLRVRTTDTKADWLYTGGAWVREGALFLATRKGTQSLSSGWNVVGGGYGTPVINEVGTWASGALTISTTGYYHISSTAVLTSASTYGAVQVTRNSTSPDGVTCLLARTQNTSTQGLGVSGGVLLNGGDVLRTLVYCSTANSVDTTKGEAALNWEIFRIR